MKTALLCTILALSVLAGQAQQKFGYAVYHGEGSPTPTYFSGMVNLATLHSVSVSRNREDGSPKDQVTYYEECLREWARQHFEAKGLDISGDYIIVVVKPAYNQYIACPSGNEQGCFMSRDDAQKDRQKYIGDNRGPAFKIVDIEY
jgi:hypothetical protein